MTSGVEGILHRLDQALEQLESAVDKCHHQLGQMEHLRSEVQTLSADRAQLADRLDKAEARAARLEGANRDASRRIIFAVEAIRDVVDATRERQ
jgi:peptidoglycan hydrolase CwlO-like protein